MQNRSYSPQLYKSGPHRSLEEQPSEILGKAMQFTWVFCKRKTTLSLFSWKPLTELGHTSIPFFLPEPHKTESGDQNKVSRITVFSSSAYTCLHRRLQVWLYFQASPPITTVPSASRYWAEGNRPVILTNSFSNMTGFCYSCMNALPGSSCNVIRLK